MKILKRVELDRIWWLGAKKECERCHSELELEEADVLNLFRSSGIETVGFQCPVCNHDLYVSKEEFGFRIPMPTA